MRCCETIVGRNATGLTAIDDLKATGGVRMQGPTAIVAKVTDVKVTGEAPKATADDLTAKHANAMNGAAAKKVIGGNATDNQNVNVTTTNASHVLTTVSVRDLSSFFDRSNQKRRKIPKVKTDYSN